MSLRFLRILACSIACLVPAMAEAVQVPPSVEAGNLEKRMQATPAPQVAPLEEKTYKPLSVPKGSEKLRFVLKSVFISGVKAYPPNTFDALSADMLGKEVALVDLYIIADHVRRRYHDDGYVLTQVFLPEQDIYDGNVQIHVMEGYVSRLNWQGEVVDSDIMHAMAEAIIEARPFDSKVLEDVMLRLNELGGITVTAALEPLPENEAPPGAAGLVLTLQQKRVAGSLTVDDYSSRYLGVWQATGRGEFYGLFTPVDKIMATLTSASDPTRMRYGQLHYSVPVHESSTTINASGSMSYTHPGFRLADLDIFSRAQSVSLGVSQPLIRSRIESLTVDGQFIYRNQQTDALGQAFSVDRLRVAEVSATYNVADHWAGANLLNLVLSRGLNIFNATETGSEMLSRARGHSDFTKLLFTASRLQAMEGQFTLMTSVTGQKSSSALLSAEQFGFGGPNFGRAYDSSEISGDEGIAGSIELRLQAMQAPVSLQPFAFYDIGKVWEKQADGIEVSAASLGFGTRVQWKSTRLEAYFAWPLTFAPATPKLGAEGKNPLMGISLNTTF